MKKDPISASTLTGPESIAAEAAMRLATSLSGKSAAILASQPAIALVSTATAYSATAAPNAARRSRKITPAR